MVQNVQTIETSRGIADPHYIESHPGNLTNRPHPHWGAIFAGIFAALSTLALLAALGAAIGASAYMPGEDSRGWGVGSGIWAIISAVLAFIVGGYVAARASGHADRKNGLFNGFMVWAVAVPLLALLVGTGISRMAIGSTYADLTPNTVNSLSTGHIDANGNRLDVYNADDARRAARNVAWGTLISLLLGLGAATLGGYLGTRNITVTRRIEPTLPVTP